MADVIQNQTPINPGNSGGPLFNNDMEMVGINSFGDAEGEGLNYAVAFTSFTKFIDDYKTSLTKPKSRPKRKESEPEDWTKKGTPLDIDEDGEIDVLAYDTNYDGNIDLLISLDGETFCRDTNHDGEIDQLWFQREIDGVISIVKEIDKDFDGEYDERHYDSGADGTVEKIEKL